jgi:hypothetical protein
LQAALSNKAQEDNNVLHLQPTASLRERRCPGQPQNRMMEKSPLLITKWCNDV